MHSIRLKKGKKKWTLRPLPVILLVMSYAASVWRIDHEESVCMTCLAPGAGTHTSSISLYVEDWCWK